MIPKIIHYCWFGKKRKPKLVKDCIASWKTYLPDYRIIEWNETNSDLSHPFVAEMYNQKKWAFVADYIRLEKIHQFGGIYLDTDMMVLKSFDKFLNNDCFFGAEDNTYFNAAIVGATKGNKFIYKCLEFYNSLVFENNHNLGLITIPRIITKIFRSSFQYENDFTKIISYKGITIYPSDYFYSLPFAQKNDVNNYRQYLKPDSVAIHLWSSSWLEYSEFHYLRNGDYKKGLTKVFENINNKENQNLYYIKKIVSAIKESILKS